MYMYGMDEELELEEEEDQQIDTMSDGLHGNQSLSYDDYQSDIQDIHPDFEDDNDISEQFDSEDEEDIDFIDQGRISNLSEVKVFIDEVICPICCHILVNPKTCKECDQAFCCRCIDKWFEKHARQVCPCCRSSNLSSYSYNHSGIMGGKIPKILLNLLSKLLLTCRHRNEGCEEVVTYEFREKHETLYCQYQIVECENLGCQERMIKKDMEEHILECEYGKVHCKYCTKDYFRRDIENHLQYCDYRPVMCQWCKIKHQYIDLQKHSEECEFRKVYCEYCKKEFKFFEMKDHTPINCQMQTAEKFRILYEKEKQESKLKDYKISQQELRLAQQEERIECQLEIIKDLKRQLEQKQRNEQSDENQSTQELSKQYDEDFEEDDEEIEEDIQIEEDEEEEQKPILETHEPSILEIKMRGLYTSLLTRLNDNNFKELWDWSEEDINQVLGWYK